MPISIKDLRKALDILEKYIPHAKLKANHHTNSSGFGVYGSFESLGISKEDKKALKKLGWQEAVTALDNFVEVK